MKRILLVLLAMVLIAAAGGYWLWTDMNRYMAQPLAIQQPVESFQLKKGTSFKRLLNQLQDEGVIKKPHYFEAYARIHKLRSKIKAGEYAIGLDTSPMQLLDKLIEGKSIQHTFTIIEGTTFRQLLERLKTQPGVIEQTLSDMTDQEILQSIGAEELHPEGLFLAETYSLERGTSDLDVLKRSYQAMKKVLNQGWEARDEKLPYQRAYEALIMASIVEKETAVAQERPVIAGVFVKRLNEGMRLQTDPTVIYGMGERYKGNITRKDLRKPTPYNTYTIDGLPPTPIAMVGRAAIEAAFNPEVGKWRYFVAKGDGYHQFSATLAQHNKAVRQYQLQRKKAYRSTPEKK